MSPLWSGRFGDDPAGALWAFTVDLDVDGRLWAQDVAVNRAHARMLAAQGVVSEETLGELETALDTVHDEFRAGEFAFAAGDEDVHMAIERRLTELAPEAGGAIHAGRSRNDQVATDFRLWCADAGRRLGAATGGLVAALLDQAEAAGDALAPGYTHLQRAQPVTLGHVLVAHATALERSRLRVLDAADAALALCPLGAGALATTTLPVDPVATAAELGFAGPFGNSLDAVASRDFALVLVARAAILAVDVSRLAEEVVLWASGEFGFLRLADAWSTGSSMMPQKKNPDVAELARATAGRVMGAFVALGTTMKGLPLAYNRDMQDDKAPTIEAADRLELALVALTGLVATATFDHERLAAAAGGGAAAPPPPAPAPAAAAVPGPEAHQVVGGHGGRLAGERRPLCDVTPEELAAVHGSLAGCGGEWLSPRACVERRRLPGGPHPERVAEAIARLRTQLA